ncbi:MAG: hypothetical protein VX768_17595 [Planctomycetota bacterium]|nr:hypothetical protein [Planctomycetota bacterium]
MCRSSLFLSFPLYAATAILFSATAGFLLYVLLFAPSSEEKTTELLERIQQLEADNEALVDQSARQLLEMQRLKTNQLHSSRLPKENAKLGSQVAGPPGEPSGDLASSTSTLTSPSISSAKKAGLAIDTGTPRIQPFRHQKELQPAAAGIVNDPGKIDQLETRIRRLKLDLQNREKLLLQQSFLVETLKRKMGRIETGFRTGDNSGTSVPRSSPFRDRGTFPVEPQ